MEEPLVLEENSVIVAKGNEELLKEVNSAIAEFKASDAYTDLQVKWGLLDLEGDAEAEAESEPEAAPEEQPAA